MFQLRQDRLRLQARRFLTNTFQEVLKFSYKAVIIPEGTVFLLIFRIQLHIIGNIVINVLQQLYVVLEAMYVCLVNGKLNNDIFIVLTQSYQPIQNSDVQELRTAHLNNLIDYCINRLSTLFTDLFKLFYVYTCFLLKSCTEIFRTATVNLNWQSSSRIHRILSFILSNRSRFLNDELNHISYITWLGYIYSRCSRNVYAGHFLYLHNKLQLLRNFVILKLFSYSILNELNFNAASKQV